MLMKEAKVSSKGQVVIPKYLRDALGFREGTVVVMSAADGKLVVMKKPEDPLASLASQGSTVKNIRRDIKAE
jgi:AbrB family looped-hinge helix DNA binding protein